MSGPNKGFGNLAEITATGNTAAADVSEAYSASFSIRHENGTGSITAGAIVQPEISYDGTNWEPDGGAFVFGLVAEALEFRTYIPPADGFPIHSVRFSYTAPVGSTGHKLNVSYGKVESLFG
jgi:hypothetical protein